MLIEKEVFKKMKMKMTIQIFKHLNKGKRNIIKKIYLYININKKT